MTADFEAGADPVEGETADPSPGSARAALVRIVAGIVSGSLLFVVFALAQRDFRPEDVGLGRNTRTRVAEEGGQSINGLAGDLGGVTQTAAAWRAAGHDVVLWLGASQLHAINKPRAGDRLAVEVANGLAAERGTPERFVQASTPNASLHDVLAMYLGVRTSVRPDRLVVAMVFDDLREGEVQEASLASLGTIDEDVAHLGGDAMVHLDEARAALEVDPAGTGQAAVERNATVGSPQERLEQRLIEVLEAGVPGYAERSQLASKIKVLIRSGFATLAAPFAGQRLESAVPEHRIAWNGAALDALLRIAAHDSTQVLLYKQPHRPSEGRFYHDRGRYDAYFVDLAARSTASRDVDYLDLETIVPQPLWGRTNQGRPDVFHFQAEGHRLLGTAVAEAVFALRETSDAVQ